MDDLSQVMKAVEAAESTIKLQLEENNRLKEELAEREAELKQYKMDIVKSYRSDFDDGRKENVRVDDAQTDQAENGWDGSQGMGNDPALDSLGTVYVHQNGLQGNDTVLKNTMGGQHYSENSGNGFANLSHGGLERSYNPETAQLSSSSASISPIRLQKGYFDAVANFSGQVQPRMSQIKSHQFEHELIQTVREHKEEILQLRKHLADYSMKEAEAKNEKYVLEKRIAQMRMAFDQQQQELVDAASKALSYREDIIKENIHLTYALQAAQQEGSTYKSSLLPLLAEYDLQPHNPDAYSIVSNLKVLFIHLHEKLIIAEEKLKEYPYQVTSHAEAAKTNNLDLIPQPPAHTFGTKDGLEIVPQATYSHEHSPTPSPFSANLRTNLDSLGHQAVQVSSDIFNSTKNMEGPHMSRVPAAEETQTTVVGRQEPIVGNFNSAAKNTSPLFKDHPGINEMDDSGEAAQAVGEPTLPSGNNRPPYVSSHFDDHAGPFLPPVLEEPGSSFSEAAEDDPLPAIHGLQLSGEPYPGVELKASGYSINGTTRCNFQWARYGEDGSVSYVEGAKQQPNYLISADDVDCCLTIRVQPVDDRNRKGEPVDLLVNHGRKILCDSEMQEQIGRILSIGTASFEVDMSAGFVNIWERAVLGVKTESYSIKCDGQRGLVAEKFSPKVEIIIPYGQPDEFFIQTSCGDEYLLKPSSSSNFNRDTIVLTMRMFKKRAIEKRNRRRMRFFL